MSDLSDSGNRRAAEIDCPEASPAKGERSESKPPVSSTNAGKRLRGRIGDNAVSSSPLEEALPVADIVLVADEDGGWHRARHNRVFDQTQTNLLRQAVTFAGVHFTVRQDTVFPTRIPAPRTRHDVVDVAFTGREFAAGVLADATIAFPNPPRAEARATQRNFSIVRRDDDRWHPHRTAWRVDLVVVLAHRQREPDLPANGHDVIVALHVESGCASGRHHAERLSRCLDMDRLPVAVQHEDCG